MTELSILNFLLTSIGERSVSSLSATSDSQVGELRRELESNRKTILSQGYWFNTRSENLIPSVKQNIQVPQKVLNVRSKTQMLSNGFLVSRTNPLAPQTSEQTVTLIYDMEYTELPVVVVEYLKRLTLLNVLESRDYGHNKIVRADRKAEAALRELKAEDVRRNQYSMSTTPGMTQFKTGLNDARIV